MKRMEKEQVINSLADSFAQSNATFVVGYKGLSVNAMQNLRSRLRAQEGVLKVAKARLMKRSLATSQDAVKELTPYCKEQVALVFAKNEVVPVAKVLFDFVKDNKGLSLIAAFADHQLLNVNGITELATLPSRAELLARLCGVLNSPLVKLMLTVKALAEQKERVE